jgi:UDP-2,3-diacylglucosamine hydrolase
VLNTPCYIISDAHLGFAPPDVERAIVSFLRHVASVGKSLVINGDLFEFWFEWKTVIPRRGFRALAALADVIDAGVPVLMIAGNHDCWGGDVLRKDVGVEYVFGPWRGDIGGWRAHIEHGDGLRPAEDKRYRALRRVLRNPLAIRSFRWIHPDLATPLANGSSHASRSYAARDEGRGLRDAATRIEAGSRDRDLIIFGHSHVATLERLALGTVYGNAGSWLDAPTFLRVTREQVALRTWNGSTESANLHGFDRSPEKPLPAL